MVNGRFGQSLAREEKQSSKEITASDIASRPKIPTRRVGSNIPRVKQRQRRALELRGVRKEAISRADELEESFFGKRITISQAEQAFEKVDPRVRQFIKTTPEVRREKAQRAVERIDSRIQRSKRLISSLESKPRTSEREIRILEERQFIEDLRQQKPVARSGAFSFSDLENVARSRAEQRARRAEAKQGTTERLVQGGLSRSEARKVVRTQKITSKQAQKLDPATKRSLGIRTQTITSVPAQELDPVRIIDTDRGTIKVTGKGAFDVPIKSAITQAKLPEREKGLFDNIGLEKRILPKNFEGDIEKAFVRSEKRAFPFEPEESRLLRARTKAGFFSGIIPQTRGDVAVTVASAGVGTAVGSGLKVGGRIVSKVGGARAVGISEKALIGLGIGLTGKEVARVSAEIRTQQSSFDVGKVVGRETRLLGSFGAGVVAGGKATSKAIDISRTLGLKELPTKSVVAPEFFKGQTFPQIKRGQTAGQLKGEFFEPTLPTELTKLPRAFTASPERFARVTRTQRGTSEVPGLFGAPKVSPRFLRTEGETKVFGFGSGILGSTRPTAIRLSLKSLDFQPGVSARTPRPVGRFNKRFFEQISGTGRSIIPFAKTEKEVITASDTPIKLRERRFFFKFGGRRVPIEEFDIVSVGKIGKTKIPKDVTTLGRRTKSSPIGKSIPSSVVNPVSIGLSSLARSGAKSSISSGIKLPSSITKSPSSRRITSKTNIISGASRSRRGRISRTGTTSRRRISRISSGVVPPTSRRQPPIKIPSLKVKEFKPRRKKRKSRDDIAIVQGFSARILKLKPIRIPKSKLPDFAKEFQTPGLRRTPVLVGGRK